MEPIFTQEQLNRMSRKDMLSLLKLMQEHCQKQEETLQEWETRIQLLEEKTKELEFLNAILSERLTLAKRKQFGVSSKKYADGYTQLSLFNEAEQEAEPDATELDQKGSTQNWMWVYLTDGYSGSLRMVLFQYKRTRAGYHPVEFFGDQFEGYFTCDGYQVYHSLAEGITVTGCMACEAQI